MHDSAEKHSKTVIQNMHIGLDLGTSSLKALLIDDTQSVIAECTSELSVQRSHSGWSEQDPNTWISAAESVLDGLAAQTDLSAVQSIGLSGHMHGATLVGASGNALRPCILWNDTRSHSQAADMDADPEWRAVSGNIVFPGFTAPKLAWVHQNEPQVFDQIDKVLLPKDFLRLWLIGDHVAEMSDAAGTSWLDTGHRCWSDSLLAKTHLSQDQMPRLVEGTDVSGKLRNTLANRWGMSNVVVAGGGGDNAASAIGMGVAHAGDSFVSLGTSGVLFAANDAYQPDPATAVHTFCHAMPGRWHQMGVILAATDALNWLATTLDSNPEALTQSLGELRAPGKTLFLPYLGGERTPHNHAGLRGAFLGLEHATDQHALTQAVLEGVAFALADCLDALSATGTQIDTCFAVGGGSRSAYWLELIATVLGRPLQLAEDGDYGAAFGAARLGQMAVTQDLSLATPPSVKQLVEPQRALSDAFKSGHARYKAFATAIKDLS